MMANMDLRKVRRFPVRGVCSVTGKKFLIIFRKECEGNYFLERVIPTNANIDDDSSFSIELRIIGTFHGVLKCPYCGVSLKYDINWVKCTMCGYINCAGGIEKYHDGLYLLCKNCNYGGYLRDTVKDLDMGD
ncbi:MAG: hypothetical protein ABGF52_05510 [Candidatus Asgardarchaeum sp.]